MKPQDVARFHIYPRDNDFVVNRANERPSRVDRRSVSLTDPLHRPLYILHPSLVVREYRGEGHELARWRTCAVRNGRPSSLAASTLVYWRQPEVGLGGFTRSLCGWESPEDLDVGLDHERVDDVE